MDHCCILFILNSREPLIQEALWSKASNATGFVGQSRQRGPNYSPASALCSGGYPPTIAPFALPYNTASSNQGREDAMMAGALSPCFFSAALAPGYRSPISPIRQLLRPSAHIRALRLRSFGARLPILSTRQIWQILIPFCCHTALKVDILHAPRASMRWVLLVLNHQKRYVEDAQNCQSYKKENGDGDGRRC
jgi:hypothetical protein